MTLLKYNAPLFPRWSSFFEGVAPEERLLSFDAMSGMVPAANIEEKENEFVISMAIPGLAKEDFNIEVHDNIITVSSEKETTNEELEKNYSRKEYSYSSFRRTFNLPQNVKEDAIVANYENGELILQLPKNEPEVRKVKKVKVL